MSLLYTSLILRMSRSVDYFKTWPYIGGIPREPELNVPTDGDCLGIWSKCSVQIHYRMKQPLNGRNTFVDSLIGLAMGYIPRQRMWQTNRQTNGRTNYRI